jgi:hypothetical protein
MDHGQIADNMSALLTTFREEVFRQEGSDTTESDLLVADIA